MDQKMTFFGQFCKKISVFLHYQGLINNRSRGKFLTCFCTEKIFLVQIFFKMYSKNTETETLKKFPFFDHRDRDLVTGDTETAKKAKSR